MLVRPQRGCDDGDENGAASFEQIVGMREGEGGLKIVAVRSPCLSVGERRACGEKNLEMVERVFCSEANEEEVRVWEETGESIARHIWYVLSMSRSSAWLIRSDIGMQGSCYLLTLPISPSKPQPPPLTPRSLSLKFPSFRFSIRNSPPLPPRSQSSN